MQWPLPPFDYLLLDGIVQIRTVMPEILLPMKLFFLWLLWFFADLRSICVAPQQLSLCRWIPTRVGG